eukprot:2038439-Alexandrium_andersonii.AAC.1
MPGLLGLGAVDWRPQPAVCKRGRLLHGNRGQQKQRHQQGATKGGTRRRRAGDAAEAAEVKGRVGAR